MASFTTSSIQGESETAQLADISLNVKMRVEVIKEMQGGGI